MAGARSRGGAPAVGVVLALLGCGGEHGGDASATTAGGTTSTIAASTSTTSPPAGSGGGGGAGGDGAGYGAGAGGAGGEGGGGFVPVPCTPTADLLAAGRDFTCVAGADRVLRCRGGAFGATWSTVALAGGGDARCVEHVSAEGSSLCARTGDGDGCPAVGVHCTPVAGEPLVAVGAGPLVAATEGGACVVEPDGAGSCTGGSAEGAVDLAALAPLGGVDGGAHDTCAWGEGGIRCWGATPSLQDPPAYPGCAGHLAVGDRFACVSYSGWDVVDCWGERPPGIDERVFLAGPVEEVALGDGFVCARTLGGLVRCWGSDAAGGLGVAGDGSAEAEAEPDWPGEPPIVVGIAAGVRHVATADGDAPRVLAWGDDAAGQVCGCSGGLVDTPVDALHPDPTP